MPVPIIGLYAALLTAVGTVLTMSVLAVVALWQAVAAV